MGRDVDLDVSAGFEVDLFPGGQLQNKLLDKIGHAVIGFNLADPFFGLKHLRWHFNLHVLLYRHLAGQPVALTALPFGNVGQFRRQDVAAALVHLYQALTAGAAAAAGRRNKDTLVCQTSQQFAAGLGNQFLFLVDHHLNITAGQ